MIASTRTISDARLIVEPRGPGDFNGIFISGVTRSNREWTEMMEQMQRDVKRHVEGVYSIRIQYDYEDDA